MQKAQVVFLSCLLAGGMMIGMTLGLAANITTIHEFTQLQAVDPLPASSDPSLDKTTNQIPNSQELPPSNNQNYSERLELHEIDEIVKMLKNGSGESLEDLMHEDGTVNTDALEKSVEAAKLKRAKELAGAI